MSDAIVRRGYTSPEFLYKKVIVPATDEIEVLPSAFENATPYRKRLVNLAFSSPTSIGKAGDDYGQVAGTSDYWARQIQIELGKTGCADQNNVRASLASFCAMPYRRRQKLGGYDLAREFRLPTPYRLPRDKGFDVKVLNSTGLEDAPALGDRATFIAKGVYEDNGEPAFLAAESISGIPAGQSVTLRSADLYNKGKRAILVDRVVLKDFQAYTDEATIANSDGTRVAWNINPTAGAQWMPNNNFIPVGNLAPMGFMGQRDSFVGNYPRAYFYPQLTYLDPQQTLGIKLINQGDNAVVIHISLFSELEVR